MPQAVDEAEDQALAAFGEDRPDVTRADLGERPRGRARAHQLEGQPVGRRVVGHPVGQDGRLVDRRAGGPYLRPREIRHLDHDVALHRQDDAVVGGRLGVGETLLRADHLGLDLVVGVVAEGVTHQVHERETGEAENGRDRHHEDQRQSYSNGVLVGHQSVRTL